MFGSKKTRETLKVLSEIEIQKKLYGRIFTTPVDGTAALPSREPAVAVQNPVESKSKPSGSSSRVGRWVRQEEAAVARGVRTAPPLPKPDFSKTASFFSKLGLAAVQALKFCFSVILTLLFSLNLRKPKIRRIIMAAGIAAFLFILFFSIHGLNLRREHELKTRFETNAVSSQPEMAEAVSNSPAAPILPATPTAAIAPKQPVDLEPAAEAEQPRTPRAIEKPAPYVIQVATYAFARDAGRIAASLKSSGYAAFSRTLSRSGDRTYYLVFLGRYETHAAAEQALRDFKKTPSSQPFQDAFVRSLS